MKLGSKTIKKKQLELDNQDQIIRIKHPKLKN